MGFFSSRKPKLASYAAASLDALLQDPEWAYPISQAGIDPSACEIVIRISAATIGLGRMAGVPVNASPAILFGQGTTLAMAYPTEREVVVQRRDTSRAELQTQRSGWFQILFGPPDNLDGFMFWGAPDNLQEETAEGKMFGAAMLAFLRGQLQPQQIVGTPQSLVATKASVAPPAPAPSAPAPEAAAAEAPNVDATAYVTPLVRKLAADNGLDLAAIKGTGVGGRIRKQDVLDAAAPPPAPEAATPAPESPGKAAPAPKQAAAIAPHANKRGTTEKMSRLRKVIAARMVESLQVSAQLTTVVEVDLTKVARLRARSKADFQAREGTSLSYLPFLALAAVEALKAHPTVNASIDGENIVYHGQENLSIAVATERGLIVPVVKNAGDLNIAGLARAIADVAERTRTNKITPDDLAGGTFTITNTGSRGALFDTPIINQPQVAILGTGALVKRPVVVEDADGGETIAIRSMMFLALSYDHRIVDGADAARFLTTMKARLEEGSFEADLGL